MYSIVIADDEKLICDSIQTTLTSSMPELNDMHIFYDGGDAYNYLYTHQTDIALLDIEMPEKTGLDIAKLLKEHQPDCYVILVTAYHDFEYARTAIHCGVNAFITKPFSSHLLVSTLSEAITFFEKRNIKRAENHNAHRHLLQTLCNVNVKAQNYDEILFCCSSTPLHKLQCTEVCLRSEVLNTLPLPIQARIRDAFICSVEQDTVAQSTLLLEYTEESIKLLILSPGEPNLSCVEKAIDILRSNTGYTPISSQSRFHSFGEYRTWLSHEQEMGSFFRLLLENDIKHAKKSLYKYIETLDSVQLSSFAELLSNQYQVKTIPDKDSIFQSIDSLVSNYIGTSSGNHIIDSACAYIQKHYTSNELSLEVVADALFISTAYLSRLFKKHTGKNFSEHLLELRMEHAKLLLSTTNLPTTDISSAVGYENITYFRMSFKTYTGMTPRQYRQLQASRKETLL